MGWIGRLIYEDATGKRKELSRSGKTKSEAKRWLKALEDDFVARGQAAVEAQEMTIGDLLQHCVKTRYYEPVYDAEQRVKGEVRWYKTIECHINRIALFFGAVECGEGADAKYVGGVKIRDIKVASLRSFRQELLMGRSIPTTNRYISTLKALLNEAVINHWIIVNPFSKARKGELITTADERERQTILTVAEERRLLDACSEESRRHLKALVIAALDTGTWQAELFRLRIGGPVKEEAKAVGDPSGLSEKGCRSAVEGGGCFEGVGRRDC